MQEIGLDTLLASRPSLRPGEVVTVVTSVARDLAAMHAAGGVHGALSAATVVLDPAGRPRLIRPLVPRTEASPADDVRALANLGDELLGPYPPQRLVLTLHEASGGTVTATALATKMLAACRPEPVRCGGLPSTGDGDGDGAGDGGGGAAGGRAEPEPSPPLRPWNRTATAVAAMPPGGSQPGAPAPASPPPQGDPTATAGAPPPDIDQPAACPPAPGCGQPAASASAPGGGRPGTSAPAPGEAAAARVVRLSGSGVDAGVVPGLVVEGRGRHARLDPRAGESGEARMIAASGPGDPAASASGGAGRRLLRYGLRRAGERRRWVVVLLGPLLLVAGVAVWAEASPREAAPRGTPAPEVSATFDESPAVAWRQRLEQLDRQRAAAYARGDPGSLRSVYVPGSTALANDLATLRAYQDAGLRVRGLRLRIDAVREMSTAGDDVTLAVTDHLDAYQVVDTAGKVIGTGRGRPTATWHVTLRPLAAGWRIASVESPD